MNKLPYGIIDFSYLPSNSCVTYPGYELYTSIRDQIFSGILIVVGWEGLA